jgi:hypothetical protein
VSYRQQESADSYCFTVIRSTLWGIMLSKPKPSKAFVVLGVIFQFIGTVIFAIALPASFVRYSGSGAVVWVFIGAILLITGLILLLVGISRALGGIDYLVEVAPSAAAEMVAPSAAPSSSSAQETSAVTGASM